jgi:hypothetical protein
MSRNTTLVKVVVLMVLVAALAMVLGGDPWGPV